jgi:hypothetical protein
MKPIFMKTYLLFLILGIITHISAGEHKWIAVGDLHDWFSPTANEIEIGRTGATNTQQDGLQWNAQFRDQDVKAAKALWIATTNYDDPISNKFYNFKVIHNGPRGLDNESEFMAVENQWKLVGKYDSPLVLVDDIPASELQYDDLVDEVDPSLNCDRVLHTVVNTSIGVTINRKVYAFTQQNHSNYFIHDYVFKNTGIIDRAGTTVSKTLTGVYFYWQYRYAPTKEACTYGPGQGWLPQSVTWGHSTLNDTRGVDPNSGDPFRCVFSWEGQHSKAAWDNIGGANGEAGGNGLLGAAQYVGVVVLHADKSATDKSDDPYQPTTTEPVLSDDADMTGASISQFNEAQMAIQYSRITAGHPALTHVELVGDGFADLLNNAYGYGANPGGFSNSQGFGPYDLAPGDSIHIVVAEAVAGLGRQNCYDIGAEWLNGSGPFTLPDGSTTSDNDEYKDTWVYTGQDSLFQAFNRAIETFNNDLVIPMPPPAPEQFVVKSGGDRINLTWANNAESWPNFSGYRVYRAINVPDTTYDLIFECGAGTNHPAIVNTFDDVTPRRGFDYYYYVSSFDDGSTNDIQPGVSFESSKFFTMTNEPAYLRRPSGKSLSGIRVVPNPYNVRATQLQFGTENSDRIMFLNIPPFCTIKIYTERGDLIKTIEHADGSGDEPWNSVTSSRQVVVSGLYIAYFEVTQDYTDPDTGELLFKKGDNHIAKFIIIR